MKSAIFGLFLSILSSLPAMAQEEADIFAPEPAPSAAEIELRTQVAMWKDMLKGWGIADSTGKNLAFKAEDASKLPADVVISAEKSALLNRYFTSAAACFFDGVIAITKKQEDASLELTKLAVEEIIKAQGAIVCAHAAQFKLQGIGEYADWNKICSDYKEKVAAGLNEQKSKCDTLREGYTSEGKMDGIMMGIMQL